ncbi:MAG: ATP-binding protein [Kiritimatiellia bacterium]
MTESLPLLRGTVVNLFLLLGFAAALTMLQQQLKFRGIVAPDWMRGLFYGFLAVLAMQVPVRVSPGIIFDCRGAAIGSGALVSGPLGALISLPLPVAYRFYVGGTGAGIGMLEILFPALFGSAINLWFRRAGWSFSGGKLFWASLIVTVCSFCGIYALVFALARGSALDIGWLNMTVFVLVTVAGMWLLTSLVVLERTHSEAIATMVEYERRLFHSQKMAALGQLAGNAAHEFLNCLATVVGNIQLAKKRCEGNPKIEPLLDEVSAAAENASRLSSQLLAFAQPRAMRKQIVDVGKCFSGIEHILCKTLGPGIQVVQRINPQAGRVEVDLDLLEQAILGIALARAEAMCGQGRLTLEVSQARLSRAESDRLQAGVRESERHRGSFAIVSIEDTASDITPDMAPRVFEPFFAGSKGQKKGGLELATAYNIVRQHGGHIEVHVLPGKGTKFLIYLPIVVEST